MRFTHLRFGVLLLGGFLLCSCAGDAAKRRMAREKQTPGAVTGGTPTGAPAWQTRLGRVVLVNSGLDFVLIDAGTSPVPEPGTRLRAYAGGEPSAELSVSIHQQRPFLIADIVSGTPHVSDMVVPFKGDSKAGEIRQSSKTASDAEPLPAAAADATRKERPGNSAATPSPDKASMERPDTRELPQIERRPPPSTQSLLPPIRPAAEESQAIIPGLPSTGKNPPR